MKPIDFIDMLCSYKLENVFNPYMDKCIVHDLHNAPDIRKKILLNLLEAAVNCHVEAIWLGRDLGYRGGRRTGLALTDDIHMSVHGSRWDIAIERATLGPPIAERTASVVWQVLAEIEANIFLWNVFPFHPHEPQNAFSNRSHTAKERKIGEEILVNLIELLQPKTIVAIGNDAELTAYRVVSNQNVIKLRHPSYGGQATFLKQIETLYFTDFI